MSNKQNSIEKEQGDKRIKLQDAGTAPATPPSSSPSDSSTSGAPTTMYEGSTDYYSPITSTDLLNMGVTGANNYDPGYNNNSFFNTEYDEFGMATNLDETRIPEVTPGTDSRDKFYFHKDIDDWSKFSPYLTGMLGPVKGVDHRGIRASRQSGWEQAGRAAVQTIGGIPLGVLENIGYLGTLNPFDDYDYENALVRWAKKKRKDLTDYAGEVYSIADPGSLTSGWGDGVWDTGWWINHAANLVESVAEFGFTT